MEAPLTVSERMELDAQSDNSTANDSQSSSSMSPPQPAIKKRRRRRIRKPTYLVRKEEKEMLLEQMEQLRKEVERLRLEKQERQAAMNDSTEAQLARTYHRQQLSVVQLSSLISDYSIQQRTPLYLPLHLPRDVETRKTTLLSCCTEKIAEARRFVSTKCRFLDMSKPYLNVEVSETERLLRSSTIFDVTHFSERTSVREVFEAVASFFSDLELHLWDDLGHVTMREDDDEVFSDAVTQRRLVSANDDGSLIESNMVMFRQYFEHSAEGFQGEHAVVAIQTVESDDLYPYVSFERIRKDLTGAIVISRVPPSEDGDEAHIALTRWFFMRMQGDPAIVTHDVRRTFRQSNRPIGQLLLRSIRDQLHFDKPLNQLHQRIDRSHQFACVPPILHPFSTN